MPEALLAQSQPSTGYGTLLMLVLFIVASMYIGVLANRAMRSGTFLKGFFLGNRGLGAWALALTATVQSEAYTLDRELGLKKGSSYKKNRYGMEEKWLNGRDGEKYYILPNGELYHRIGEEGAEGELVATLDPIYYLQPGRLHKAKRGGTVTVVGNQLTVTPSLGFVGRLMVTVTVSDGRGGTDSQTFAWTVS